MKRITVANCRQDPCCASVVKAVARLLQSKGYVAPIDLFVTMDLLSRECADGWRRGRIPYLERVIRCNLSKASRILRILRLHAHDLRHLSPLPSPAFVSGEGGIRRRRIGRSSFSPAYLVI